MKLFGSIEKGTIDWFRVISSGRCRRISKTSSVRPAAQQHVPGLRSASSSKCVTPWLRTKFEERAFSHAGPAAWNSLPPDIHAAASPAMFKQLLKTRSIFHLLIFSPQTSITL